MPQRDFFTLSMLCWSNNPRSRSLLSRSLFMFVSYLHAQLTFALTCIGLPIQIRYKLLWFRVHDGVGDFVTLIAVSCDV